MGRRTAASKGAAARELSRQTRQRIEAARSAGRAADNARRATKQQSSQSRPQD